MIRCEFLTVTLCLTVPFTSLIRTMKFKNKGFCPSVDDNQNSLTASVLIGVAVKFSGGPNELIYQNKIRGT